MSKSSLSLDQILDKFSAPKLETYMPKVNSLGTLEGHAKDSAACLINAANRKTLTYAAGHWQLIPDVSEVSQTYEERAAAYALESKLGPQEKVPKTVLQGLQKPKQGFSISNLGGKTWGDGL